MYIQTSSEIAPNVVIKDLFKFLYNEYSEEEISGIFKITKNKCRLGREKGAMDFDSFMKLKGKCQFSYANLYYRGLDHQCIKARLSNQTINCPEKYTKGAFSSKRTSHAIIHNLDKSVARDALDFLQIDRDSFYSDELISKKISTLINSDLLEYLVSCHLYRREDIYHLGQMSGIYNLKLPFGKAFRERTAKESFEIVIQEIIRHFETSFEYRLVQLTESRAIIRRYLTEKMKGECKTKLYSNKHLCKYIEGSFSAIPLYSNNKFARTIHKKCVFEGHEYCEYHVYLNDLSTLN